MCTFMNKFIYYSNNSYTILFIYDDLKYLNSLLELRGLGDDGAVSLEPDGGSSERRDVLLLPPSLLLSIPLSLSTLFSAISDTKCSNKRKDP